MGYQLGVDIGTTHTAAAVLRRGRAEMARLSDDSAAIASIVFLDADGAVVVGNAASEQGFGDPTRVARAFKRRLGDPDPIILGGRPHSADDLLAQLLRRVVDIVAEHEGARPDLVTVTRPANWGDYRTDLFDRVIRSAGLESVRTISDPEAVAIFHGSTETTTEGDVVLVYDLGGGTFDATVVRRTSEGYEVVGASEGIDRLGGIDFDEAVLLHMAAAVGVGPADFEGDDPATVGALARLRFECAVVKETLSTSTEVSVPVFLPGGEREVRVTRDDLAAMVRPALTETIEVLRRTLVAAHLEPADIDTVVLAGGSSRIPLVAQLVSEALGRPVTVSAEPKHAVALGAALSMAAPADTQDAPPSPPAATDPAADSAPVVRRDTATLAGTAPPTTGGPSASPEAEPSSPAAAASADTSANPREPGEPTEVDKAEAPEPAAASTAPMEPTDLTEADKADKAAKADPPVASDEPATSPPPGTSGIGTETGSEPPSPDGPAEQPAERRGQPSMSLRMSIAAAIVALAMIGAAAAAGSFIGAGKVPAGIGLVAAAVAAGVALLLMVKRPAEKHAVAPEAVERPEESSL